MSDHENQTPTLAELPVGSRLILRCKKDWREAVVSQIQTEKIVLIVCAPSGKTYRVRRPLDAAVTFDGELPILNDCDDHEWRAAIVKYDVRW